VTHLNVFLRHSSTTTLWSNYNNDSLHSHSREFRSEQVGSVPPFSPCCPRSDLALRRQTTLIAAAVPQRSSAAQRLLCMVCCCPLHVCTRSWPPSCEKVVCRGTGGNCRCGRVGPRPADWSAPRQSRRSAVATPPRCRRPPGARGAQLTARCPEPTPIARPRPAPESSRTAPPLWRSRAQLDDQPPRWPSVHVAGLLTADGNSSRERRRGCRIMPFSLAPHADRWGRSTRAAPSAGK